MTKLSDIERMKNRPHDPKGFTCYCPKCEFDAWACSSTVDKETGTMLCEVCGTEFEPEE